MSRRGLLLAGAFVLVASLGCRTVPVARPAFDAEECIDRWVNLWNTYDLSRVRELFLDDERVTYFSSEREGLIEGIESLVEHHVGFGFVEGGKSTESRLWMEDLQATRHRDASIVTGTWFFRPAGESAVERGPVTFVIVISTGEPRIAHAHFAAYPAASP